MGKHYENLLENVNRQAALRVTTAYRTSPTTAILVIAKIARIKLTVQESREVSKKEPALKRRLESEETYSDSKNGRKMLITGAKHHGQTPMISLPNS